MGSDAAMNRRDFVRAAAGAGIAAATPIPPGATMPVAAQAVRRSAVRPLVIADASGIEFKNGGPECAVERAFRLITEGKDVLDALIAGVNIPELDPEETGIGYGALPNADGVVQLDASCMRGPRRRAGGVAAIEGVDPGDSELSALTRRDFGRKAIDAGWSMLKDGLIPEGTFWGTINCNGINANGEICGVTTTSGLAWKIPGRVGDSPTLGASLYVDNDVGAAGSTGRGEANLYNLSSYLIVESMRRGMHPKDAGMEALKRIRANTIETRLLNARGLPNFNIRFFILDKKGQHAGVAMYGSGEKTFALCTDRGAEAPTLEPLLAGNPAD